MPDPQIILRQPFLVIIPVWNRSFFTRIAVNSVLKNGSFNLVYSLIIFDNHSIEIDRCFLDSNLLQVITGNFPNANYCLNELKKFSIPDYIRFIVKIDNDIEICPGFFQTILQYFKDYPLAGSIFFAKHGEPLVNYASSYHGGVFATRRELFDQYPSFPLSGKYPGCEAYHKFVVSKGFNLFSIPCLAIDLSESYSDISREYIAKGWQRDIYHIHS
jgi:hypothetical protein